MERIELRELSSVAAGSTLSLGPPHERPFSFLVGLLSKKLSCLVKLASSAAGVWLNGIYAADPRRDDLLKWFLFCSSSSSGSASPSPLLRPRLPAAAMRYDRRMACSKSSQKRVA